MAVTVVAIGEAVSMASLIDRFAQSREYTLTTGQTPARFQLHRSRPSVSTHDT